MYILFIRVIIEQNKISQDFCKKTMKTSNESCTFIHVYMYVFHMQLKTPSLKILKATNIQKIKFDK